MESWDIFLHKKQLPSIQALIKGSTADHLIKNDLRIEVTRGGIGPGLIREDRPHPPPDLTVSQTDKVPLYCYIDETGTKGAGT